MRLSPELWFSETAQQREDRDNIGRDVFKNMINMQIKPESSNASPKEIDLNEKKHTLAYIVCIQSLELRRVVFKT